MPRKSGATARKPRRPARLTAAAGLIVSAALGNLAHAVVLGAVQVRSSLGQPLVAEVELLDGDQDSLKAGLASPSVHRQHGFQSPHQLGSVSVRVVDKRNGKRVLRITSERAVNEPTLELLLQAEDRAGSIVRYTPVLLDPAPTGRNNPLAAAPEAPDTPAQAPARVATERPAPAERAQARRPEATEPPAAARPERAKSKAAAREGGRSEPRSGARPSKASATAAHAATPADGAALAQAAAATRVSDATPAAASPAPARAPSAADGGAAVAAAAPVPSAVPAAGNAPAVAPSSAPQTPGEPPALAAPAQAASPAGPQIAAASAAPAALAPHRAGVAPTASPAVPLAQTWSFSDYLLAGSATVLTGAALIALGRRRRRHADDDLPDLPDAHSGAPEMHGTSATRSPQGARTSSIGNKRGSRLPTALSSSVFNSSAFNLQEEVDPVAEADVYLAYGRADHAKAILEEAVRHHPGRAALHLKLLSIHFDQRDALAFNERARALAEVTGQQGPEWQEARAMGLRLDRHNPLFAASRQAPESGRTVDFDVSAPSDAYARDTDRAQSQLTPESDTTGMGDPAAAYATWTSIWQHPVATQRAPEPDAAVAPVSAAPAIPDTGPIEFTISVAPAEAQSTQAPLAAPAAPAVDLPLSMDELVGRAVAHAASGQAVDLELLDLTDAPVRRADVPRAPKVAPASPRRNDARAPDRSMDAANASRFDALPAKLALIQRLAHTGERGQAAQVAQEVAQLLAQLRGEAASIASAVALRA